MSTEKLKDQVQLDESGALPDESPPEMTEHPVPPDGMTQTQLDQSEAEARALVQRAFESSRSDEMHMIDGIINVGVASQRDAANKLGRFKSRIGESLVNGGAGNDIASGLGDLRRTLNYINPSTKPGLMGRVANRVPILAGRQGPLKTLRRIAARYEPVSVQIAGIESNLRRGRVMLVTDNVELRKLYQQIEGQQDQLKQAIYFGELLAYNLSQKIEEIEEEAKHTRFADAYYNVMMRIVNLRSMESVHTQYFLSIEMTRQNNVRLGQAVEHTLSLATNVITIGIAIQHALARQKAISEAASTTRDFLADVVTGNAEMIKQHTAEIGDLYTNPVIATDKIAQAHSDLIEALDSAEQLREEGLARMSENISELTRMSQEIEKRLAGVESDEPQRRSIPESVSADLE